MTKDKEYMPPGPATPQEQREIEDTVRHAFGDTKPPPMATLRQLANLGEAAIKTIDEAPSLEPLRGYLINALSFIVGTCRGTMRQKRRDLHSGKIAKKVEKGEALVDPKQRDRWIQEVAKANPHLKGQAREDAVNAFLTSKGYPTTTRSVINHAL